jgi:hypothetical protein
MKWGLRLFFAIVFMAMLFVTTWASLDKNVFAGGALVMAEPWGVATLFDTYFAFLTFYLWVLYKESSSVARLLWLLAILLLGNFAMAIYALIQIQKSPDDSAEGILLRSKKRAV